MPILRSLSTVPALSFAPGLLDDLARHAEESYPRECCGALLGRWEEDIGGGGESVAPVEEARIVAIVACENVAPDPRRRYAIAPQQLFDLQRAARRDGVEVVGYYHSHPAADGTPSPTDRAESWPELAYVIIPVDGGAAGRARAWCFSASGEPIEEEIRAAEPTPRSPRSESP